MAYRFLVVDDTNFMRKMAAECLRQFGYEAVGEAADGKEAIRLYEELRPDVVLMDLTMPEMNGVQAIKAILDIDPGAVILICTASNEKEMVLQAMDAGAKGYLMKPFNAARLQEIIRKYAEPYLAAKAESAEFKEAVDEASAAGDAVMDDEAAAVETEPEEPGVSDFESAMEQVEAAAAMVSAASETAAPEPVAAEVEAAAEPAPAPAVPAETPQVRRAEAGAELDKGRERTRMKSFVSSIMCQWQEVTDGETIAYSVVCTESEDKLVIERTNEKAEKQVVPFNLESFRELADWLDNHLGARQ